jgi:hypothetical protein
VKRKGAFGDPHDFPRTRSLLVRGIHQPRRSLLQHHLIELLRWKAVSDIWTSYYIYAPIPHFH